MQYQWGLLFLFSTLDGVSRHSLSSGNPGLAGIAALDDPCPDVIKLNVKLTSLAVTVLHIDPVLTPSPGTKDFHHDDTTHPLACMAETFFSNLGTYGFGGKDFEEMAEKFAAACTSDHLRYSCAFISVTSFFSVFVKQQERSCF